MLAVALRHRGIATLGALAFTLYLSGSLRFTLALGELAVGEPGRLLMPNVGLPLLAQVVAVAVAFTRPARNGISLISRRTLMLWMPFGLIGLAAGKVGRGVLDAATNHEIALWKPVPWLIIMAAAAGYAAGSVVGRRAAPLLFLPVAALGDLGKLPSLPTSAALAQIGCVLSAFAIGMPQGARPAARGDPLPPLPRAQPMPGAVVATVSFCACCIHDDQLRGGGTRR
ncbi:hypothetical protein [Streptosporangium roseum]|uniref:hypothetical protein n=1 Tax=Streptosporangium roseum TaxID=2001 RepID=UPI003326794E